MAWTEADLEALETSIKSGVRSVEYADATITYHSLDEMLRLREVMKQSVQATPGTPSSKVRSTYAKFTKD